MRVRGPRARADNTVCVAGGRAVPASEVTAPAGAPGAMRASKPRTHSSVRRSHILALPSSLPEMSSGRLGIISRQLTESSCPSIACRVTPSDVHRPSGGTGGGLGRPSAGDPAHGCPLAPPAAAGSASSAASKSMVRVDITVSSISLAQGPCHLVLCSHTQGRQMRASLGRSARLAAAAAAAAAAGAGALGHTTRASACDDESRDDVLATIVMFRHGARTV